MLPPSLIAYNIMLSRLKIPLVGTMFFRRKIESWIYALLQTLNPHFYGFTVEDE
jgi:hypothetical protein